MPNYQNGKIYKIMSDRGPNVYIGSTTKTLQSRFIDHKSVFRNKKDHQSSCYIVFNEYGLDNCYIELIEECPCNTIEELRQNEEYWRKNTPNTVNTRAAFLTPEELLILRRKRQRQSMLRKQQKNIYCPYCDKTVRVYNYKRGHLKSKKHQKNVDYVTEFFNKEI
jgi:hypothetical protein